MCGLGLVHRVSDAVRTIFQGRLIEVIELASTVVRFAAQHLEISCVGVGLHTCAHIDGRVRIYFPG